MASNLRHHGYADVIIHDIEEGGIRTSVKEVVDSGVELVGIDAEYAVFSDLYLKYSAMIRELKPKALIVWGGVNAFQNLDLYLRSPYVDVVTIGESEETIVELAHYVEGTSTLEEIPGVAFRRGDRIIRTGLPRIHQNLDELPLDLEAFDWSPYIRRVGQDRVLFSYQTSRGCPFKCTFCYNSIYRRPYRAFSEERIISDLKFFKRKYNVNKVRLIDDLFFIRKERAIRLLKKLFAIGISIYAVDLRASQVSDDVLGVMEQTGCTKFYMGTESPHDEILKAIKKAITRRQIEKALLTVKRHPRLECETQFMFGLPYQSDKHVKDAIDTSLQWMSVVENLNISYVIYIPYPGTPLYNDVVKYSNGSPPIRTLNDLKKLGVSGYFPYMLDLRWTPHLSPDVRRKLKVLPIMSDVFLAIRRVYRSLRKYRSPPLVLARLVLWLLYVYYRKRLASMLLFRFWKIDLLIKNLLLSSLRRIRAFLKKSGNKS